MKDYKLSPVEYYETFGEMYKAMARKYAEKPAISYFVRGRQLQSHSYGEFTADIGALAAALRAAGLGGRHIGIVGENSYQWLLAFFAVVLEGGVAVCVDAEQPDEAIREMLLCADVEAVFVSSASLPLCRLLEEGGCRLLLMDEGEDAAGGDLLQMMDSGRVLLQNAAYEPTALSGDQRALIVFTSGTTNTSKPVLLSHKSILTNACDSRAMVCTPTEIFTSLPFYHTYGLTCGLLGNMGMGAHICINGNLKTTLRDLKESGALMTTTVPLLVESLYKYLWLSIDKAGKKDRVKTLLKRRGLFERLGLGKGGGIAELVGLKTAILGKVEMIICGGAHLDQEIIENFRSFGVLVLQGYGITECSPLVSVNREGYYNTASVGQVVPHSEVKIVEEEIWVRGDNIMEGYYKAPALTAEVFEDGWFKTGDLGHLDSNGFLHITGRRKNLIVFKNGKKISPEKVEQQLCRIPMVKDVIVYAAASGASADDVKLAISVYPDPRVSEGLTSYEILEQLQTEIDHINSRQPSYQQIQMVNIREKEFAKTSTAKIKRHMV